MSRVPWKFGSYIWPINPDTDTGWIVEQVYVEHVPLTATSSVWQHVGRKSQRRRISGWIYGPHAAVFKQQLTQWYQQRIANTLIDHMQQSQRAFFLSLSFTVVPSVSEWKQGRAVWRYDAELVAV